MKKYTKTYSELPRGIGKLLNKLDSSIAEGLRNFRGKQTRYIIAYNGNNEPRGILEWCYRCHKKFGNHNMPFLANMDTSVRHRGYGELLFNQFLSEIKHRFFLFCLDENAEQFWRHIADKHRLVVTSPFKSSWGTPALLIKNKRGV